MCKREGRRERKFSSQPPRDGSNFRRKERERKQFLPLAQGREESSVEREREGHREIRER